MKNDPMFKSWLFSWKSVLVCCSLWSLAPVCGVLPFSPLCCLWSEYWGIHSSYSAQLSQPSFCSWGFPDSSVSKESTCKCRWPWVNSWVGKIRWRRDRLPTPVFLGFPCGLAGKEFTCNVGDLGSVPGLGRSPGKWKGYPLQYSGLENSMDCIVHGVTENQTWLSDFCGLGGSHFLTQYLNFSRSKDWGLVKDWRLEQK